MNRMLRRTKLPILFAALAALAGGPAAQETPMPGGFPAMALGARVQSDTIWIGEPVALKCRVVNWLGADLTLIGSFGLRGRDTEVRIVEKDEPRSPYWGPFEQAPSSPERVALRYAKGFEYAVTILYDPDAPGRMAFRRPGDYAILVRQKMGFIDRVVSKSRINSFAATVQTPRFRVVAPPPDQTGALAILSERPSIMRDMQMRNATAANWEIMQDLVNRYPQSRYAPWCLDAMAYLALQIGRANRQELLCARDLFEQLVRDYPDYPFRDEARAQLADIFIRTEQVDRAADIIRALIAEDEGNMFRFRKSTAMLAFLGPRRNSGEWINDPYWYLFPTTDLPCTWFHRASEEVGGGE